MQYSADSRFGVVTTSLVTSLISSNAPGKYRVYVKYGSTPIPLDNDGVVTVYAGTVPSPYRSYVRGDGKGAMQASFGPPAAVPAEWDPHAAKNCVAGRDRCCCLLEGTRNLHPAQIGKDEQSVMRSLAATTAPIRPAQMALGRRYTITTVAVDAFGNDMAATTPYPNFILGTEFGARIVQGGGAEPSRDQPGDGTTVFSFTFTRPGYYVVQVRRCQQLAASCQAACPASRCMQRQSVYRHIYPLVGCPAHRLCPADLHRGVRPHLQLHVRRLWQPPGVPGPDVRQPRPHAPAVQQGMVLQHHHQGGRGAWAGWLHPGLLGPTEQGDSASTHT